MARIYIPILSIIFLVSLSYTPSFSQEIEWQSTIGGHGKDELTCILPTIDGGYLMGGSSKSLMSGNKSEDCLGGWDYWVVKTDAMGTVLWDNTYGGFSDDWLTSIKQTEDGGFILGGYSGSDISTDKSENCLSGYDYWIIKINAVGIIQWDNTIGGSNSDILTSIEKTTDGGYILGGHSGSNISGDKTENSVGFNNYYDYWIVKIDSIGNILWQNTIGGNNFERLTSIRQTSDGGYILGGYSSSGISGDKSEAANLKDYWIVKTDSLGNIQWQNTIGGISDDYLYSVIQTIDGGYLLGGSSLSSAFLDKTEVNLGMHDFWIVKTDSIGNVQWDETIGGNLKDMLYSVVERVDGGFVLCGASESSISNDKTEDSKGRFDYWIVKTDSTGSILSQKTIGGSLDDEAVSFHYFDDENYILGGFSKSGVSGDKTQANIGAVGENDFWIVKLTNKYNIIKGRLFADFNSDGVYDIGEPSLIAKKVTEEGTGRFTFTGQDGDYSLIVLDPGNYTLSTQSVNWYTTNPASHTATFSSVFQVDSLNDFAFQPQGSWEDVCITITPMTPFRSGFTAYYIINYGNYGNTTVAPTVYFYPYSNVTFQSATLTPSTISPDSVVWSLPAMAPFQTGSIIVTVNVNLGLPIGTLINSSAHIEPYLTDDNPSNNNSNWEVYTSGSYDPNDILVNEDTLISTQLSYEPWLEYIIRFQNTGNDTAFTVKILNPIDTNKLKLSTFEFLLSSHPVTLKWKDDKRIMEFKHENILLPDSNTNEPLSHGFVKYRVQPKTTLKAGDLILSQASIYFDFNEPVLTNIAKTIIIPPSVITSDTSTQGELIVFPNPTSNTLNIAGIQLENGKAQLRLMDIYGKLIIEKTITSITTTIETNNLAEGIYVIQSGELRATFVKL